MIACPEHSHARECHSFCDFAIAGNMDLGRNGNLPWCMTLHRGCHHNGMPIGAATMDVTHEQLTMSLQHHGCQCTNDKRRKGLAMHNSRLYLTRKI